jgi:hypothetical protein
VVGSADETRFRTRNTEDRRDLLGTGADNSTKCSGLV